MRAWGASLRQGNQPSNAPLIPRIAASGGEYRGEFYRSVNLRTKGTARSCMERGPETCLARMPALPPGACIALPSAKSSTASRSRAIRWAPA